MTVDFSLDTTEARGSGTLASAERENYQLRILHAAEILFKNIEEIQIFLDEGKL